MFWDSKRLPVLLKDLQGIRLARKKDSQGNKLCVSFGVPLALPVLIRCVHVA